MHGLVDKFLLGSKGNKAPSGNFLDCGLVVDKENCSTFFILLFLCMQSIPLLSLVCLLESVANF